MGRCIYIFTNSYKPNLGGIQTVTSQVAETLHALGENVVVVTKFCRKGLAPYSRICGVPVFRFAFEYFAVYPLLMLLFFFKKPKVVYVHFPQEQAKFVYKLHKLFDFKLVTCFHGHDVLMYEEGYDRNNELYKYKNLLVHASDAVTACSGFLAKKVESIFSCNGVIPVFNGVDLSRFEKDVKKTRGVHSPYIFAFGRLERIKGYEMLIEAFSNANLPKDWQLIIAGEGSLRQQLQEQISRLKMDNRIHLIGRKSPDDIVSFSKYAEINIIPSFREPFGIVALEAIAAKRPVIATNAGGLPEVADKRFCLLCEPSVSSVRYSIENVANGRYRFSYNEVEEYLKEFSIDRMVDNYIKASHKE